MRRLSLFMCIVGFVGMVILSIISIAESQTGTVGSLVSAIPVAILFASLFITGFIAISNKDR